MGGLRQTLTALRQQDTSAVIFLAAALIATFGALFQIREGLAEPGQGFGLIAIIAGYALGAAAWIRLCFVRVPRWQTKWSWPVAGWTTAVPIVVGTLALGPGMGFPAGLGTPFIIAFLIFLGVLLGVGAWAVLGPLEWIARAWVRARNGNRHAWVEVCVALYCLVVVGGLVFPALAVDAPIGPRREYAGAVVLGHLLGVRQDLVTDVTMLNVGRVCWLVILVVPLLVVLWGRRERRVSLGKD